MSATILHISALKKLAVGDCGVCHVYGEQTHFDAELSWDANDCRAQHHTGGELVCAACARNVREAELQLRAWLKPDALKSDDELREQAVAFDRVRHLRRPYGTSRPHGLE